MDLQGGIGRRVLIVEDEISTRQMLRGLLGCEYDVREACDGRTALDQMLDFRPEIVLLDIGLPDVDGLSLCRQIRHLPSARPPQIIMISSRSKHQDLQLAFDQGADDYLTKPVDASEMRARLRLHGNLLDARRAARGYADELAAQSTTVTEILEARRAEHQAIQNAAIYTLAKVAELRDHETGNHLIRMSEYSGVLAATLVDYPDPAYRLSELESHAIPRLSTLHDIGKVGISDSILLKPAKLTAAEWRIMKTHTLIGWQIIEDAITQFPSAGFLRGAALIAKYHHERWDGKGYPCGLKGKEIPLLARIVAIADVFDALTSDRPYRSAWSVEKAHQHIMQGAGTHFDPCLVEVFDSKLEDFRRIQRVFAESSSSVFQYVLQTHSRGAGGLPAPVPQSLVNSAAAQGI